MPSIDALTLREKGNRKYYPVTPNPEVTLLGFYMHKEIEQLNKMIQEIVVNQVNIVEMIENKSLP